jgi:uncharacterized membrane protein (DUF106 family)
MELANRLITGLFGFVFWPLRILPPVWALIVISIFTGAVMVWVFGRLSRQDQIRRVKDQIRGKLFGVRLYQHEIGVVLRLQRQIIRHTVTYMNLSVVPMLVLLIPLFLIIVQLNLHFGKRPLRPGEQTMVKVTVADSSLLSGAPLLLKSDQSFIVETPPVRALSKNEIAWRIRAVQPGLHTLTVQIGEREVEKHLRIGNSWGPVSPVRTANWLDFLLYPAERRLDRQTGIRAVEVAYRPLPLRLLGWNIDWFVFFFVLSVGAGFALKGVLGVQM